jgi:hypothetical protein
MSVIDAACYDVDDAGIPAAPPNWMALRSVTRWRAGEPAGVNAIPSKGPA